MDIGKRSFAQAESDACVKLLLGVKVVLKTKNSLGRKVVWFSNEATVFI